MAKKDYSQLEKEELIRIIDKLESRKRYGLVWDEEKTKEQFEKESEDALPVLKEVKNKEISTDFTKPINILIEGDNYHALSVLNYTHQGKVDVIYIDPPYNRGGDFKYNDEYFDKDDPYRHSKWLSFMTKRLHLAKKLLKDTGVIFISIDDNEMAQLKLVLDNNIFSELKAIGPIIWQKASGGGNAKQIVIGHEYILCYGNQDITFTQKNYKHDNKKLDKSKKYIQKGGEWFFVNDDVIRKYFGKYPKGVERRCEYEDLLKFKNKKIKNEIDIKIKTGEFILRKNPNNPKKHFICALEKISGLRMVLYSIIQGIFNAEGKEDLIKDGLSEDAFDYPKPVRLIKLLLDSIENKNAIILDFFAGSGTTAKAVAELNKEDGGNRRFILCTNDEGNICTEVCYPRLKNIIKGYKFGKKIIAGLGGNLRYFKTTFVKKTLNQDQNKINITSKCTEMLCLREGIFRLIKVNVDYSIFKENDRIMAIYYSFLNDSLKELKKQLDKIKGKKILYCFTLDQFGLDRNNFMGWDDVVLEPIPQKILDLYEEIYEY